jgi:hypothetical protein
MASPFFKRYIVTLLIFFCSSARWISTLCYQCHGFSILVPWRPDGFRHVVSASLSLTSKRFSTKLLATKTDEEELLCAAVLVPGFLTGAKEFESVCRTLTERGIPTVAVPMPNWHWLPCLGGRSARPILELIDFTVKHLIANDGDVTKIPKYEYSLMDTWIDFRTNPGGILQVGGSSQVDKYPVVEPRGTFPEPQSIPNKKVALIGHR